MINLRCALPFIDVVMKKMDGNIRTSVYKKSTYTVQYFNYESTGTEIGIIKTLYN